MATQYACECGYLNDKVRKLIELNRSEDWKELARLLIDYHADEFFSFPGNLLDIGCGLGTFCNGLSRSFPGQQVIGIDRDSDMIEAARACGDRGVRFLKTPGNSSLLDFENDYFAFVTCMFVLGEIRHPIALLEEVRRVLKPCAHAVFVFQNPYYGILNRLTRWYTREPKPEKPAFQWSRLSFQFLLHGLGMASLAIPFGKTSRICHGVREWVIVVAWKEQYDSVYPPRDWGRRAKGRLGSSQVANVSIRQTQTI